MIKQQFFFSSSSGIVFSIRKLYTSVSPAVRGMYVVSCYVHMLDLEDMMATRYSVSGFPLMVFDDLTFDGLLKAYSG